MNATSRVRGDARAAVVIVNFGSHRLLDDALGHLSASGMDVVVVDNPTTQRERAAVLDLCRRRGWALLSEPTNVGFGAAVNDGVRHAIDRGADSVVLLNPDCVVDLPTLGALKDAVSADALAVVTPCLTDVRGRVVFDGATVDVVTGQIRGRTSVRAVARVPRRREHTKREWVPATCLAIGGQAWERIGGFDESFFLYWEDVDLSVRCVDAGGRLVVRRDLFARHDAGGTQGRQRGRGKSPLYLRWNARNRLVFAARHVPPRNRWTWLWATPAADREILLRGGRRPLLSWRPWFAVLLGTVEGFAALIVPSYASRIVPPAHASRSRATVEYDPVRLPAPPTTRPGT